MSNEVKHKIGSQFETTIRSWKLDKTKVKKSRYVQVVFNGYIEKTFWLSDDAIAKSMEVLGMLGFQGSNLKMLALDSALNTEKSFFVTIESSRVYNGNTYYSASWIQDPDKIMGGFSRKDMTDDELDEFDIDTSGYIENAKDLNNLGSDGDSFKADPSASFASEDIPF